jgi:hypothetical protein
MSVEAAIAGSAPQLLAVGGVARDTLRALVVVTPRARGAPPAAAPEAAGAALALWLSPDAPSWSTPEIPDGHRFGLLAGAAGAAAVARRLDEYRASGHLVAAYCGTGAAAELVFEAEGARRGGGGGGRPHVIPQALVDNLGGRCDHAAIAAGRRPASRRIELLFTAAERQAAAAVAGTRQDFSLSVKLSPDHLPSAAEAHQRGKGSFNCARPSYSVKLSGKRPRFVLPGAATSQFLLLSMCEDDLYLRNHTAARILAAEGLFPGAFGFVELVVDGASKGVYLMTENPSDWMRQQHPGTLAIVRRLANGAATYPEVDWTASSNELATVAYGSLLAAADGRSGDALEAALRARFDLDKYLTWLAAMSVLMSGDYVDEILFQVTDATDDEGARATFQTLYVWDQENLLSPCHHMGRFAVDDRRGLLYCAEAELDRLIVSDPLLYRRYVDALERFIERLPRARFEEALGATVDRLLEHFSDPQTVAAMTELRRKDPEALGEPARAKALVRETAAELLARFEARQEDLAARIAFYRAHPEAPYPTDAGPDPATGGGAGPDGGPPAIDAAAPELDLDGPLAPLGARTPRRGPDPEVASRGRRGARFGAVGLR